MLLVYLGVTFLIAKVLSNQDVNDVIVTLNHGGRVQGSVMKSLNGADFYAFRGIPYAESPEGNLRFRPPVAKAPWGNELFNATVDGPLCVQMDFRNSGLISGVEDCLRVNVYTNKLIDDEVPRERINHNAVLVFIHGGGFMGGGANSQMSGPEFIMDTDIVLVTFNYRLDAFGFLSTGDEHSPGNYGLMDQSLVLQWIQENIGAFGGDKKRVTIFGISAGGASVSFHLMSPFSAGLFQGAIQMSGAATSPWTLKEDELYWAKRLASDVGCPTGHSQELVECLRNTPAQRIIEATPAYMSTGILPLPFTPNVDGFFLPDHPAHLLKSPDHLNRVPVISGVTQNEGVMIMSTALSDHPNKTLASDDFLTYLINGTFGTHEPVPEVTELIKNFYFKSIDRSNASQVKGALYRAASGLIDMTHYEVTSRLAQAGFDTFAYSYEYKMSNFSFAAVSGIEGDWGVSHGDDIPMFFAMAKEFYGTIPYDDRDKEMRRKMIKIYTDFAKYGTPVPKSEEMLPSWPTSKADDIAVYHINDLIRVTNYNPLVDPEYQFWTVDVRNALTKAYNRSFKDEL